jgi:glycosyltransferase involved in cell wall biosynthesis
MVRISVIIPTIGRASLAAALKSCIAADEIIVVIDDAAGPSDWHAWESSKAKVVHVHGGDHGYTARHRGMEVATGTHLAFLDDDDVYLPGAIDLFRGHATDVPVIFRMDHYDHGILWRDKVLEFGNVSTQMMLVPNVPEKLGSWEPYAPELREPGGDYTFLAGCVEKMGAPLWRAEIVAKLRPTLPTIAIVTPWLDHPELLPDYAAAVQCRSHRDELLVVDNGSEPAVGLPGLRVEQNLGFAAACNLGLHEASSDAVLFLNNDVAMTSGDWLARIRNALEPGVLVGADLRYDPHGSVDGEPLPYLDGWCLGGMRDDLVDLGGFDESFDEPAYYSDNDLCLRARANGLSLREVRVGLRHKLNVTAGRGADVAKASAANRERFLDRARDLTGVAA